MKTFFFKYKAIEFALIAGLFFPVLIAMLIAKSIEKPSENLPYIIFLGLIFTVGLGVIWLAYVILKRLICTPNLSRELRIKYTKLKIYSSFTVVYLIFRVLIYLTTYLNVPSNIYMSYIVDVLGSFIGFKAVEIYIDLKAELDN